MTAIESFARNRRAVMVVTGSEILRGFVTEGNVRSIAVDLRKLGIDLAGVNIVGDSEQDLRSAFEAASNIVGRGGIVISTGGLGPTHDDRTSEVIADVTGRELMLDSAALQLVRQRVAFLSRGRQNPVENSDLVDAGNRKQALLPQGAKFMKPAGTAPGYVLEADNGVSWVVLPGPPAECSAGWAGAKDHLFSEKDANAGGRSPATGIHERLLRLWGVPESHVGAHLASIGHVDGDKCTVTICARDSEIELSVRGLDVQTIDELIVSVRDAFRGCVFAVDDERTVEEIIGAELLAQEAKLVVCESCTGGMLGSIITEVPGSSSWFIGGFITYLNEMKQSAVGVGVSDLANHGAVSEEVAAAMAEGAAARVEGVTTAAGGVYSVAITGVAGPGGGSDEKPVGTVHIAIAHLRQGVPMQILVHRKINVPGNRHAVRRRTSIMALHLLRRYLETVSKEKITI